MRIFFCIITSQEMFLRLIIHTNKQCSKAIAMDEKCFLKLDQIFDLLFFFFLLKTEIGRMQSTVSSIIVFVTVLLRRISENIQMHSSI